MVDIHGFSEGQFESLRSKTKKEFPNVVARSLANAKVLGNRIIHFFRKCEWVTDKKLANWAITEFENFDPTNGDPNYRLTILKVDALCTKALLAAKENSVLLTKYINMHEKIFPSTTENSEGSAQSIREENRPEEQSSEGDPTNSEKDTEGRDSEGNDNLSQGESPHRDSQQTPRRESTTPTFNGARGNFLDGRSSSLANSVSGIDDKEPPLPEKPQQPSLDELPSTQTRIEEEDRFEGKGSAGDSDTSGTDTDESEKEEESLLSRREQRNRPTEKEDLDNVNRGFDNVEPAEAQNGSPPGFVALSGDEQPFQPPSAFNIDSVAEGLPSMDEELSAFRKSLSEARKLIFNKKFSLMPQLDFIRFTAYWLNVSLSLSNQNEAKNLQQFKQDLIGKISLQNANLFLKSHPEFKESFLNMNVHFARRELSKQEILDINFLKKVNELVINESKKMPPLLGGAYRDRFLLGVAPKVDTLIRSDAAQNLNKSELAFLKAFYSQIKTARFRKANSKEINEAIKSLQLPSGVALKTEDFFKLLKGFEDQENRIKSILAGRSFSDLKRDFEIDEVYEVYLILKSFKGRISDSRYNNIIIQFGKMFSVGTLELTLREHNPNYKPNEEDFSWRLKTYSNETADQYVRLKRGKKIDELDANELIKIHHFLSALSRRGMRESEVTSLLNLFKKLLTSKQVSDLIQKIKESQVPTRPQRGPESFRQVPSLDKGKEKLEESEEDQIFIQLVGSSRSNDEFVYRETDEFLNSLENNFSQTLQGIINRDQGIGEKLHERFNESLIRKQLQIPINKNGIIELADSKVLDEIVRLINEMYPSIIKNAKTENDKHLVARLIQIGLTGDKSLISADLPHTSFIFAIKTPSLSHSLSFEPMSFLEFYARGLDKPSFDREYIQNQFGALFVKDFIQASTMINIDGEEYSNRKKNLPQAIQWLARKTVEKYHNDPEKVTRKLEKYNQSPFFKDFVNSSLPIVSILIPPYALDEDQNTVIRDLIIASDIREGLKDQIADSEQLKKLQKLVHLQLIEKIMILNQKTINMFFMKVQEGYQEGYNDEMGASSFYPDVTGFNFALNSEDSEVVEIQIDYAIKDQISGQTLVQSSLSGKVPSLEAPVRDTEFSLTSGKMLFSWESDLESITSPSLVEMQNTIQELHTLVQETPPNLNEILQHILQLQSHLEHFNSLKVREMKNAAQLFGDLQVVDMIVNEALNSEKDEEKVSDLEDVIDMLEFQKGYLLDYIDLAMGWEKLEDDGAYSESFPGIIPLIARYATTAASNVKNLLLGKLRNINEHDHPIVNRIKSSKYESLMNNLKNSFQGFDILKDSLARKGKAQWVMNAKILAHLDRVIGATQKVDMGKNDLNYLTLIRDAYQFGAIRELREAVKLCESSEGLVDKNLKIFTYELAYNLYVKNNMHAASEAALNMLKDNGGSVSKAEVSSSSAPLFIGKLRRTLQTIENAPEKYKTSKINRLAKSGKDHVAYNFSPIEAGNPPQIMDKLMMDKKNRKHPITIIGMGSPTIQCSAEAIFNYEAEIDPIFRAYLHVLESRNLPHLYVSLQDARGKSAEKLRNKPIMALQDDPAFEKSFFAITFSKNSHFYEGEGSQWMPTFKQELHDQFFKYSVEESGCSIPKKVQEQILAKTGTTLEEVSKKIIDNIEKIIDQDSIIISEHERKLFIELYYNLLTTYIASNLDIRVMNFTCKDGIDRGMGALAWFEFMWMIVNDLENEEQSFKTLDMIVNTRAYWVRKRAIMEARGERFFDDATLLLEKIALPDSRKGFKALLRSVVPDVIASELESSKI
ncbi:hypothetical protein PHSC3_000996 [Chlamydiales bacterium STE3]|nr:hypothetical protein PHSC3_000996 [Chlamydiales bacterium STE3]